jgi:Zn-dependent protease
LDLNSFLLFFPVLLFSVVAHEYAHGYAALKQGDPTAYQLGRLTWNPVKHVDPLMTFIVPGVLWYVTGGRMILGGAKPVPVNPRNYRNFKRGDIIVSLAGVATNFALALVATVLFAIFGMLGRVIQVPEVQSVFGTVQSMLDIGVLLNLSLIAFNLLPIPPLDGSHVMKYILPPAWSLRYQQIGGAGIIILIVLINFVPGVLYVWMAPARALYIALLSLVGGLALPTMAP